MATTGTTANTGTTGTPGNPSEASTETPGDASTGTRHMHRGALTDDPDTRAKVATRLKRIEGQVRGIQKMVDEGRYCPDILTQVASVHAALRGVGKVLMRSHLQHCVTDALRSGDPVEAERTYDEVMDLMYRHVRE